MTGTILRLAAVALMLGPAEAAAQVFGTFSWQMQPYCNRVTLTLANSPGGFVLSGSDDTCGAAGKAGAAGVAVFNADGTVGLNFTIVAPPAGHATHVSAVVSPVTGQGTWSDDVGHTGSFAFGGSLTGLPVRPSVTTPIDVADNPNEASDPCAARTTLTLCGTSISRWMNGGYGLAGLQVWRDKAGKVHIRGSAARSSGTVGGAIFMLPASWAPRRTLAISVATGLNAGAHSGGTALLVVYGDDVPSAAGLVAVTSPSTGGHSALHLGEIAFSVDR